MFSIRQVSGGESITMHFTNEKLKIAILLMLARNMSEVEEKRE